MRDLRRLAELHVRDVGFVDFDFGLDDRHVGQRQQHGAGVVHRADHRRFAFLDVAARHDAFDGRLDADLAQVVLRVVERRALLHDAAVLRLGALVALLQGRFGGPARRSPPSRASRASSAAVSRGLCCRASVCFACSSCTRAVSTDCRICSSDAWATCSDASPLSTRVRSDFGSICSRNWPTWMRSPSFTARLTTRPAVSAVMLTSRFG